QCVFHECNHYDIFPLTFTIIHKDVFGYSGPFVLPNKWIKDLHTIPDAIQLLEENVGQTLSDINNSNIFSDPPIRVLTIKRKINKWDLIKLQSFCTAKETLNNTKRPPQNGRKSLPVNQLTRDSSPKFVNTFCSSIPK
uniref:Uncharacterized protein n=1 Tax=Sus scrofa TaxID=9823 RepID=A0A8D1XNY3_PIG